MDAKASFQKFLNKSIQDDIPEWEVSRKLEVYYKHLYNSDFDLYDAICTYTVYKIKKQHNVSSRIDENDFKNAESILKQHNLI